MTIAPRCGQYNDRHNHRSAAALAWLLHHGRAQIVQGTTHTLT